MLNNMPKLTQFAIGNYPILAFKIVNFFRLGVQLDRAVIPSRNVYSSSTQRRSQSRSPAIRS
jgi:hypothetical protein